MVRCFSQNVMGSGRQTLNDQVLMTFGSDTDHSEVSERGIFHPSVTPASYRAKASTYVFRVTFHITLHHYRELCSSCRKDPLGPPPLTSPRFCSAQIMTSTQDIVAKSNAFAENFSVNLPESGAAHEMVRSFASQLHKIRNLMPYLLATSISSQSWMQLAIRNLKGALGSQSE